ncbi:hypothetical protein O181_079980 [Austropuccinia psidii MF-1]|uniref:Uncharacterized protein n=1 Tax=Austropuccinia psidii MF-1 TaxID=1389203 RepID=A0A9Q3IIG4_9BASI|nr:hypothetical protein [Austropuccinia psidii MF-1]
MGVAAILTWNQVGANWPHHIFYGQLVPSGALWPFGHILPSLASLANFHITNPQALIFDFGLPLSLGQKGQPSSPQGQVGPKPQLGPPEPILFINPLDPNLAKNPLDTKMAIEPVGPILTMEPPWTIIPAMASGNHQRPLDQLSKNSPQLKGNSFHSSMHPVLNVAGVVHIWCYIPLCTIFSQKLNGDVFRTKYHNSKSRFQNPTPILKEDSLTHQSGNPWRQSEDHSRIPTTWPCRSGVGNFIQDYSKGILRGYTVFQ